METTKLTIEQYLNQADTVRKTKKLPVNGIIFIVAGMACIAINKLIHSGTGSILPSLFVLLEISFLITGALLILLRKTAYADVKSGQKLHIGEVLFARNELNHLTQAVQSGNLDGIHLLQTATTEGVKLRIASAANQSVSYAQVLHYIPYKYVCTSDVVKFDEAQTKKLFAEIG